MKNGDVLLLGNGQMLRIIQKDAEIEHIREGIVQFIDKTEETYLDLANLDIGANLGNSPEVVATFYSTWGLNLRLNRMGL